ncbi:mRNA export factor Srp2 [Schizosaccharomyces japonicus yFS275]|uniref:mRNA export factor Srp2 n=1 Tax=Schizosaccharomyces japonicus (strain yFS275 / FY16936) TaxID=402676 RepID=B6JVL1_SCHJY|nr:mRNA export factor Srp2 [Schizosaccharomyces japonicus yFS275]EEB05412.2 mRNA export factor Srp2 [Schizosaccharomyces japonicus yFS275]
MSETRLFIGRLPSQAAREDVEDFFKGYGRILDCKLMNGFGFLELENPRDARDIVNDFNGKEFMGERIIVEPARGERRRRDTFRDGAAKYPRPRRTGYRLIVENLAEDVSWQDLKDVMRKAGEPTFTDAHREQRGTGVVEFSTEDDMKHALDTLNGETIKGQAISLREDPNAANEPIPDMPYRHRSRSPPRRRFRDDYRGGDDYRSGPRDDYRRGPPRDDYRRGPRDDYRRGPPRDDYRRGPRSDFRRGSRDDDFHGGYRDDYRRGPRSDFRRNSRDDDYRSGPRDDYRRPSPSRRSPPPRDDDRRSPAYDQEAPAPSDSYGENKTENGGDSWGASTDAPQQSESSAPAEQSYSNNNNSNNEGESNRDNSDTQVAAEW